MLGAIGAVVSMVTATPQRGHTGTLQRPHRSPLPSGRAHRSVGPPSYKSTPRCRSPPRYRAASHRHNTLTVRWLPPCRSASAYSSLVMWSPTVPLWSRTRRCSGQPGRWCRSLRSEPQTRPSPADTVCRRGEARTPFAKAVVNSSTPRRRWHRACHAAVCPVVDVDRAVGARGAVSVLRSPASVMSSPTTPLSVENEVVVARPHLRTTGRSTETGVQIPMEGSCRPLMSNCDVPAVPTTSYV